MVKVEVVLLAGVQHPALGGCIHQQAVQVLCRVEAVLLAATGRVDGVLHGQFRHRAKNGVRAADAEPGLLLYQVMHTVDVLRTVAATAEIAHSMASEISLY